MTDTAAFEALLVDCGFGPSEGRGIGVVAGDEVIDVLPELVDRGEGGSAERFAGEDGEPDLDLIEPGSPCRGEVEVDVGVSLEPLLVLLVSVEVVEMLLGC